MSRYIFNDITNISEFGKRIFFYPFIKRPFSNKKIKPKKKEEIMVFEWCERGRSFFFIFGTICLLVRNFQRKMYFYPN